MIKEINHINHLNSRRKEKNIYYIPAAIVITFFYFSCKKSYAPPAIQVDYKYLAVEGTLINSIDSPSVIKLSRTLKITDTTTASLAEENARVSVEGENGVIYNFFNVNGGTYQSSPLALNPLVKYRLKISTADGDQYESAYVELKKAPPIDSLAWHQQNDVMIFLYTHDPSNNAKYYQWDYTETYQYEAPLNAELSQDNGRLFYVDNTPNQTYDCWRTVNSTEILAGTSIALDADVISKAPITIVPQNSQKISIRYSILVRQYALTREAYQYFEILKKNTETLGSIFDAQPSQLIGNIHFVKNPSEIVIGFFTASNVQAKRLFIAKSDVINWNFVDTNRECSILILGHPALPDPGFFVWNYSDPDYYPYYFCGSACLTIARRECVDCRVKGGTNQKPTYW